MGMFILSRGIQISLQTQSKFCTLPFLPSWARRPRQCTSACSVRYSPGTCAESEFKNTKKLQTSDGCKETVQSFPRARVCSSTGGKVANGLDSSGLGDASVGRLPIDKLPDSELMFDETTYADADYEEIDPNTLNDGRISRIVENKAIELLAARALSAFALRKKLTCDKFPHKIIDSVLVDLENRGLLNDSLYAESFSRSRWLSLSWGPRKIKRALLEKGISPENASKAACQVFEDEDSIEDKDIHLGMSKSNLDRLFAQASKQWLRGRDKKPENRKSGMVRWLQYRGFDWTVTKYILRKLELEQPL